MNLVEAQIRRLFRISSWSNSNTVIPNLLNADVIALSHNPLLVATASRSSIGVGFSNAEIMLKKKVGRRQNINTETAREVAKLITASFFKDNEFLENGSSDFKKLLFETVYRITKRAYSDLAALGQAKLPERIWTGTFNKWSCRAIGLTILSRAMLLPLIMAEV